jgi:hypothetical protein
MWWWYFVPLIPHFFEMWGTLLLELGEDHDGADGECMDEHDGGGGAEEAGCAPEDAEEEAVERELRVHEELGYGVGESVREPELRLMRQHGERRDEAQAEEAAGAEQRSDLRIADGEICRDDAGQDERPDDAPGEGSPAATLPAGGGFLPWICLCA